MNLLTAASHTKSVPGFGRMNWSARVASSCSRMSNTMTFVWPSFCARFTRVARTGWLSAALLPTVITRLAFSMSLMVPLSAPIPVVRDRPLLAGDWQYREQLSTLFVPIT